MAVKWRLIFIDIDGNIEMGSSVDFDIDCQPECFDIENKDDIDKKVILILTSLCDILIDIYSDIDKECNIVGLTLKCQLKR